MTRQHRVIPCFPSALSVACALILLLLTLCPHGDARGETPQPTALDNKKSIPRPVAAQLDKPRGGSIDPLAEWQWRNPFPSGDRYSSVAYGKGTFVAVGQYDSVYTSPDGVTWTQTALLQWETYYSSVAYGNGTFVIAGFAHPAGIEMMSPAIYTSPDGITWTAARAPLPYGTLLSVNYCNGMFVAVGSAYARPNTGLYIPLVLTSADGVTWSQATTPACLETLSAVTYGGGKYVAVGDGPVLTSRDGVNWNKAYSPPPGTYFSGIAYGDGYFMATAGGVYASSDAVSWNPVSVPEGMDGAQSITYADGQFVTAGWDGQIMSYQGGNWTARTVGDSLTIYTSVAYGNGTFVAVGQSNKSAGKEAAVATSPDGVTWTDRASSVTNRDLLSIAYGNGAFVAVGVYSFYPTEMPGIVTSPDGITWQGISAPEGVRLLTVIYENSAFLALGYESNTRYYDPVLVALTSADGIDWTRRNISVIHAAPYSVTYGKGIFVAVGGQTSESSAIITSPDGVNWTGRTVPGPETYLLSVACGNGAFVAVGRDAILTSTDGASWTPVTPPGYPSQYLAVAYGNGTFVIVGRSWDDHSATIFTSPDGITWTQRSVPSKEFGRGLFGVAFGNGMFVAIGSKVYTSVDGVTWALKDTIISRGGNAIAFGANTFVAVGEEGTIIQSSPLGKNLSVSKEGTGSGSVVSSPQGIDCGGACTAMFTENDVITLTATARPASEFLGWSGACTGTGPCTVVLSDNMTVTALFVARPALSASPASLRFAKLKKGGTSAAKKVTITNTGAAGSTLTVDAVAIAGTGAAHFRAESSCAAPLAKKEKCTISVFFAPLSSDASMSAVLEISTNAPLKGDASIKLAGASGPPRITASPAALSFPATPANGSPAPAKTITIRNAGLSDLTISSVTLRDGSDASFAVTNGCSDLEQGKTCKVTVTFNPASIGKKSGWVDIVSNASANLVSVELRGTGK